jgi:Ca2+-binding EF-hand superfamily protein
MRLVLTLLAVCMFATTAAAQFGTKGSTTRPAVRPSDTTQKKTTTEKGHPGKVAAADQAAADTDLANALLAAMDTDGDGVVSKIEMNKAMAALRKVHKDNKGNMVVPDKAATDPNAAAAAGVDPTQGPGGVGAAATGDARNNNEAMGWFTRYDANHDGRLSANEVPAQAGAMLGAADLNGDGFIDAREFQAFSRKMGDRMKAMAAGVNPNGAGGAPGDGRAPKP